MPSSGYVLVGGRSSRMGRDKALLPYRGTLLVKHIAVIVDQIAGNASLIGDPARYGHLGYAVYADEIPGCGPLGGLYTALRRSETPWNLVVACDMPGISADVLRGLLERTGQTGRRVVAATGRDGRAEPLCAAYHRDCLPEVKQALDDKRLKMMDLMRELDAEALPVPPSALANLNTPAEWAELEGQPQ